MHIRVRLDGGESGRNPQLADSRPSGRLFYYRFEVIACTLQSLQAASPMLSSPQMRRADASARVPSRTRLRTRCFVSGTRSPRPLSPLAPSGRNSPDVFCLKEQGRHTDIDLREQ